MTYEHPSITLLKEEAKKHGLSEEQALKAWEEMKAKYKLPAYVEPELVVRSGKGSKVVLIPAVNINLLSRLDKEVPGWEKIEVYLK